MGRRRIGRGFLAEVADAVAPRTVMLVVGVLAIQLLFIASYVDAFSKPSPHRVPVDVVAPAQASGALIRSINQVAGHPLQATAVSDRAAATAAVRGDHAAAALVIRPGAPADALLVASGGGAALEDAVEGAVQRVEGGRHRRVAVEDLVPLQPGDYRGLSGFYLVIGWIVGGYLAASMLGITVGERPATTRRAFIRLLAAVPYAVLSGLGGALVVDQIIGAQTGHFIELAGLGALVVAAAMTTTMAFQVVAGVLGIGLAVLVFVVAGNPSAGGAYQRDLLPGFFRVVGDAIPNGAGVDTVRRIVYFGGQGVLGHLLLISGWIVVGAGVTLLGSRRYDRSASGEAVSDQPRNTVAAAS